MNTNGKNVIIVGAGPGDPLMLNAVALDAIKNADLVIGTDRLYEKLKHLNSDTVCCALSDINSMLKTCRFNNAVILASGDIGFYSISKTLKKTLSEYNLAFINGMSSLQYLASKLMISYDDVITTSVHGREQSVVPYVCYNRRVFVLTGGKYKAHDVIDGLVSCGLGEVKISIGENLSDKSERIITDTAINLKGMRFDNLTVMLIENQNSANSRNTLHDSDFIRDKVPMTKGEIRNLSIARLNIQPTDIVYDIGAGTGSVAIAMAYRADKGLVYAVEKNDNAVCLLNQNRTKLKAFNLNVINETAPDGIYDTPPPDKVFIGGSGRNMDEIIKVVLEKNPNAKIIVNAVTLETLNEALDCFKKYELAVETVCANISRSERLGSYTMMKAHNPVYIIYGERQSEL